MIDREKLRRLARDLIGDAGHKVMMAAVVDADPDAPGLDPTALAIEIFRDELARILPLADACVEQSQEVVEEGPEHEED